MGGALGVERKANEVRDLGLQYLAAQREMQMALNLAQARDFLQYLAGLWTGCATLGVVTALRGKFPKPLAVPIGVLPLVMIYQADMAYFTKIRRVCKEAEHIMVDERWRFVPPTKAPFYKFYENEAAFLDSQPMKLGDRVGSYWPAYVRGFLETPPFQAADEPFRSETP
ncbi:Plasminogen receptor KT [Hondaea fermentalgiana]|uniref:Plasminogen receptor KT n=1 Tax=Hondaea fermentalgiana TaxID=2315210 RepID=A0A2R5GBF5_9STRA|nr:Plasminogen receptor KT [Hondaea fermentalgiana]|eukprot:GBG25913.1 Plasminogen receptor KT [Hondaea fermentalgiana]